jgi:predicted ATPase
MITQIEIDGFKSFKDFKVELAPFQVIVGANGSGKSNLFDALQLLGRLASHDLLEAFQGVQGEANDLFLKGFEEEPEKRMFFAVEMLLDHEVENDLGQHVTLQYTRLRYEVDIITRVNREGLDQFSVNHEALKGIPPENDTWLKKYAVLPAWWSILSENGEPDTNLVQQGYRGTPVENTVNERIFPVYGDTRSGHYYFVPDKKQSMRTALNQVKGPQFVAISAVRAEMMSWKFVHLDPDELRKPNSTKAPRTLSPRGNNLASTLVRMQAEDKFALSNVSRDMINLVPGVLKIRVERDKIGDRYVVYAEMTDKRVFSSQMLSDGTLRLLALATLKNDSQLHGILCLEEPENGVSPSHLGRMAHLLRQMAPDLSDPGQVDRPLCQVLVSTHSPLFISQPDVINALLLAFVPSRIQKGSSPMRVTRMAPVITSEALSHLQEVSRDDKAVGAYTSNTVKKYLDSELLEEARERLEQGQHDLNER